MAQEQSGILNDIPWSSTEGKGELYDFARELGLAGINSRSGKADIVAALVAAQKIADGGGSQSQSQSRSRSRSRSRKQARANTRAASEE
jgi:hypothetical protein